MRVRSYLVRFLLTTNLFQLAINFYMDCRVLRHRFTVFGFLTFAAIRKDVTINRRLLMEELFGRFNYAFRYAYRRIRANSINGRGIFRINKITANLNVRIYATVTGTSIASSLRRYLNRFRIIGKRLIYVPTILMIAAINISKTRRAIICNCYRFILRNITHRDDIIRFSIRLRVFIRVIDLRRTSGNFNICVVLIFYEFRQFQFGRRNAFRTTNAYVITNSNRRLYRILFLALLIYVRR